MILTQRIGDNKTHSIPLAWNGRPFIPGAAFNLIWTLKSNPEAQSDAEAAIQKQSGYGLSVTGSHARVSLIPLDTAGGVVSGVTVWPLAPGTLHWDIQAQSLSDSDDIRTVAHGSLTLLRDVSRRTVPSIPIYVLDPPADPIPANAYVSPSRDPYLSPSGDYYVAA